MKANQRQSLLATAQYRLKFYSGIGRSIEYLLCDKAAMRVDKNLQKIHQHGLPDVNRKR